MLIPEKDGKHFTADVDVEVSPSQHKVDTFGKKFLILYHLCAWNLSKFLLGFGLKVGMIYM